MRTAIVSDIHGNLVAFRSSLEALGGIGADRILCLGDIVGYNPWPNECVDIIRQMAIPAVMGNHDRVAAGIEEPDRFNSSAREAILWTRELLTRENRDFLASLPDRMFIGDSIVLVHGSPREPDEYIISTDSARENMRFMSEKLSIRIGFFGHTHIASAFVQKGDNVAALKPERAVLEGGLSYLINPGSIGQPRDGDVRASLLIYDYEANSVEFFRVEYDIGAVSRAISDAGLPTFLARRLFLGR